MSCRYTNILLFEALMNIAIIGAGPAGCAAAYAHFMNGDNVVVLEREESIGGRTRCFRNRGFTLDTGAGFVTNFYSRLFSIANDLEFDSELYKMNRISGLFKEGTLAPLNIGSTVSFFTFPFISLSSKLKFIYWIAKLTLHQKKYDLAEPKTLAPFDVQSIAEHARKELNEEIYHSLIRPGIEPFWYFSCEEVSQGLLLGLSSQAAGAQFFSFPNGIDVICEQLTKSIDVRYQSQVQRIEEKEKGYRIHFHSEKETNIHLDVDKVVVATTATIASSLTDNLSEQSVSSNQRSFLTSQEYASNVHVCVEIPKMVNRPTAGSIFPIGTEKHALAAISFHNAKYPEVDRDTELISIFLSNSGAQKYMPLSDEELYKKCWALAREYHSDFPQEYTPFYLIRRKEAIPVHAVGRYRLASKFLEEQKGKSICFCGDYLATATIEGAIASGLQTVL